MIPAPYGSGVWQLFNVAEDPGEAKDLSKRMPDRLEDLKAAWDAYAADVGVILPEEGTSSVAGRSPGRRVPWGGVGRGASLPKTWSGPPPLRLLQGRKAVEPSASTM